MAPLAERLVSAGKLEAARWVSLQSARPDLLSAESALVQFLVNEGDVSAEDVLAFLGEEWGCSWTLSVSPDWHDASLLEGLSVDYLRRREVLPVRTRQGVRLLVCDASGLEEAHDMAVLLGEEPEPIVCLKEVLRESIDGAFIARGGLESAEAAVLPVAVEDLVSEKDDDLLREGGSAPAVQWVNRTLLDAARDGASDVHLEPGARGGGIQVRFRIDGVLRSRPAPAKSLGHAVLSRLKVLARMDVAERRLPQDGMTKVRMGDKEMDIRISTVPVAEGERVVLRLLRHDTALQPLTDLGMSEAMLEKVRDILALPHGVVWVTGPTGSGKTTSLYAALNELDSERRNVLTIEDPVEYQLPGIGQISVKPSIGLTFARGLRHILRQDPDVILVGETRDRETAEIVVQASLTGHLVFSTLHTNDAMGAFTRLIDMGVPPFMVAESTRAVLAQRLVRRLIPEKSESYVVSQEDCLGFSELVGREARRPIHGLSHADDAYAGRVGLFDCIFVTPELESLIRAGKNAREWKGLADGLRTDAVDKIKRGLTSVEEAASRLGLSGGR